MVTHQTVIAVCSEWATNVMQADKGKTLLSLTFFMKNIIRTTPERQMLPVQAQHSQRSQPC